MEKIINENQRTEQKLLQRNGIAVKWGNKDDWGTQTEAGTKELIAEDSLKLKILATDSLSTRISKNY